VDAAIKKHWQNYIDGVWCEGSTNDRIPVENPATEQEFATIARGTVDDIDRAVLSARNAVNTRALYEMVPHERMRLLLRIADELRKMREEIVPVIIAENGKNVGLANDEVEETAQYFEYYAGLAGKLHGRSIPLGKGFVDYTQLVPLGVSAHIIPWNFPLEMAGRDVAPALACGNAIVIKSPELSPLMLCFLVTACERAGLPKGYVNLVCGYGNEAGEALASHPGVDHIAFTGSVVTGKRVAANAAPNLVPCLLELGGKSAGIVFPDADLDRVVHSASIGIFAYAGQICSAGSRLLVHRSIREPLIEKMVNWVKERTQGPGEEDHFFTPLISGPQRDKVENLCQSAIQEGATTVIGGRRPDRSGFYMEPTIVTGVKEGMSIHENEVFGPVLSVVDFDGPDEAIAIANSTPYGLAAGVYTTDLKLAHWAADRLEAGSIYVNKWFAGGMEVPFGGFKNSGYGRVKSTDGLANYYQIRNVAIGL
jgi:aldehyde dehydrogenase (NAD+)/betaine-aldehyde dehydrogenase